MTLFLSTRRARPISGGRMTASAVGATALLMSLLAPAPVALAAPPEAVVTAGNNAFFRSDRVEIGSRPNATFGSDENAPDGTWHPRDNDNNGTRVGFRYLRSGTWASGVTDGDFFLPGGPYEGWGVEVVGGSGFVSNNDSSSGLTGTFAVAGGANPTEVVWTASAPLDSIGVVKRYSVPADGTPRLRMDAVFTNSTGAAIDVLYFRGVDADNCIEPGIEDPTGPCAGVGYDTTNQVVEQRYAGDSRSAVASSAEDGSVLVLWTEHADSVAYFDQGFCGDGVTPTAILGEAQNSRYSTVASPFNDGVCSTIVTQVGESERADTTIGLISQVSVPASGTATVTSYYELSGTAFGLGPDATPTPAPAVSYVPGPEGIPSEPVGTGTWQETDGTRTTLTPADAGPNEVRYGGEGIVVTLTGADGSSAARGLVADADGEVECEICATLAAGGVIEAWMFSKPRLVAAWRIEDLPCQRFTIPVGAPLDGGGPVPAGAHTLQLALPTDAGMQAVNVGVLVGGPVPSGVPSGEGPAVPNGLLASVAGLAVFGLGFGLRRRAADAMR